MLGTIVFEAYLAVCINLCKTYVTSEGTDGKRGKTSSRQEAAKSDTRIQGWETVTKCERRKSLTMH